MRLMRRVRKIRRSLRRNESGISLIEGMAGMIMLSLGLLTLLPLATISLSGNELARDTADAAAVMQNQIERLRNQAVITDGSETDPETGMYSHWWVETDPNGLQKVNVEVTWYTDLGVVRYQKATTYIYRTEDEVAQ